MAETTSPANSSNQNILGALCYLLGPIVGIVLLLVEKENKFVRFHAMQSVITFGGLLIFWIACMIIGFIPFVGWIVSLVIGPIVWIVWLVLWVLLMYKAFSGEMYKLPYVGNIAEQQLVKMK